MGPGNKLPEPPKLLPSEQVNFYSALLCIMEIHNDTLAMEGIKEKSRPRYEQVWNAFKNLAGTDRDWDTEAPTEEEVLNYIRLVFCFFTECL